jgi:hypothetical protein
VVGKLLAAQGLAGYADFPGLAKPRKFLQASARELDRLFTAPEKRVAAATAFASACDERVNRILGLPRGQGAFSQASATGLERDLSNQPAGSTPFFRTHFLEAIHLYTYDAEGRTAAGPVFIPPGRTSQGIDQDFTEEACYWATYPALGNLQGAKLYLCHLEDPQLLLQPGANPPQNPAGSVRVGSTAADPQYTHIHFLVKDLAGRKRSFVDAFCR